MINSELGGHGSAEDGAPSGPSADHGPAIGAAVRARDTGNLALGSQPIAVADDGVRLDDEFSTAEVSFFVSGEHYSEVVDQLVTDWQGRARPAAQRGALAGVLGGLVLSLCVVLALGIGATAGLHFSGLLSGGVDAAAADVVNFVAR